MIQNAFEFTNLQELRRRVRGTLETGKRNLTGAEYEQWAPSLERKVQEIDKDVEDFLVNLAFGKNESTSTVLYARYFSTAKTTVPVHATVISGGVLPTNLLTGVLPEVICPYLPFASCL